MVVKEDLAMEHSLGKGKIPRPYAVRTLMVA